VDIEGYRPTPGEKDITGALIPEHYNQKDFGLVIDERTKRVARWVSNFLKQSGDRFQKTIIFCVDTDHASRLRQAIANENAGLVKQNPKYVMRIRSLSRPRRPQPPSLRRPRSFWRWPREASPRGMKQFCSGRPSSADRGWTKRTSPLPA
jgi:type I restriction enzyme R subunit